MKIIYIFLLAILYAGSGAAQTVDLKSQVFCTDSAFLLTGGFSMDSSFISGVSDTVPVAFYFSLETGSLDSGDKVTICTSLNQFVQPGDPNFVDTMNYHYVSTYTIPNAITNPGSLVLSRSYDAYIGDTVGMLLDMDYFDLDSIVYVGPPWDTFQPCHAYGLFAQVLDVNTIYDTSTSNLSNNISVVPVIYDCFAAMSGGGHGTGIGQFKPLHENVTLSIYPNPAQDKINIEQYFDRNAKVTLRIIDVLGHTALKRDYGKLIGSQKMEMDVSMLPAGIYTVELSSIYRTGTGKFIKQ